jgi:hypothetical protein
LAWIGSRYFIPIATAADLPVLCHVHPGQHDPDRHHQQHAGDDVDRRGGRRQRHQGQRGERDRSQRRVGERQVDSAPGVEDRTVGVERLAFQPGLAAHPVDVGVDAVGDVTEELPAGVDNRRQDEDLGHSPEHGRRTAGSVPPEQTAPAG